MNIIRGRLMMRMRVDLIRGVPANTTTAEGKAVSMEPTCLQIQIWTIKA